MKYANQKLSAYTTNFTPAYRSVRFPFGLVTRKVMAGPYRDCPDWAWGVNLMAEEPKLKAEATLPIRDFSTPNRALLDLTLEKVVVALSSKDPVYIGCRGGLGRTGTVLGALAVVLGVPGDPVLWVREHYARHAIETYEQERFVRSYEPGDMVSGVLAQAKLVSLFYWWKRER